jgi:mitochondrial enoyl-[acyl-carrier protein] reductase / trans-2-enoyl-CoA reductase
MADGKLRMMGKKLVFHDFGKPCDVLRFEENSPFPEPTAHQQVLVRIIAAPLNPADLNTIEGTYGIKPALPATPGTEGCGVVEMSRSPEFVVGDRVIFLSRAATWASHVQVSADQLFKLPLHIDPLQAALLKINPATAWRLLHGFVDLEKGSWIVQNAGNSAVGRCVIQLARHLGIRTVSFVRRPELTAELSGLGGDHVFSDDSSGLDSALEVLGGATASLAYNAVGGDSALRLMKLLKESGTHITYGAMARKPLTLPNGLLIFRDLQIRGLWVSRWLENAPPEEVRGVYGQLANLVADGKIVQSIDSTHPLHAYREALARLDYPERSGKVVFTIS